MSRGNLARYRVTAELPSTSGHFRTFIAVRRDDGSEVELRLSTNEIRPGDETARNFLREIKLLANLRHPNVIDVLDLGRFGNRIYYVTSHRNSLSIDELMKQVGGPLSPEEVMEIGRGIGSALDFLHRKGLVHRRLTGDRIFFDIDAHQAYIADLSTVTLAGVEAVLRDPGSETGLPVTPEHFLHQPYTPATDLFLLGVLLYRLSTGAAPFPKIRAGSDIDVELLFEANPPSTRNPAIPDTYDALIAALIAPSPSNRFRNAGEFLARLSKTCRSVSMTSLIGDSRREIIDKVRRNLAERRREAEEAQRKRAALEELKRSRELEELKAGEVETARAEAAGRRSVLVAGSLMAGFFLILLAAALPHLFVSGPHFDPIAIDARRRRAVIADQVGQVAGMIDDSPVTKRNFHGRLALLEAYREVSSNSDRTGKTADRLPSGETLSEIGRQFSLDPDGACKRLDQVYRSILTSAPGH